MKKIFLISILLFSPLTVLAETYWSDFSVSLLRGTNYEVSDSDKFVTTVEHAAATSWGDSFIFLDRLMSDDGDIDTYAEFSPRFELSNYENAFFKNVYLATTAELGSGFTNYLVGVGTNLKIPHFKFFKVNVYQRNNELSANGKQVTLTWGIPIGSLYYDGFADIVFSTDDKGSSMNYTSQLKYDIGPTLKLKNKLFIGVEYVYWKNKFGIDGITEKNANLLVKYHF